MREALDLAQSRIVETAAEESRHENSPTSTTASDNNRWGKEEKAGVKLTVKANAHIRITHLPPLSDLCKPNISSIRGNDLGALIQIQVRGEGGIWMGYSSEGDVFVSERVGRVGGSRHTYG